MIERKNIMIVGSGGREDALAWMIRQSSHVGTLCITPGNGGSDRFESAFRQNVNLTDSRQVIQVAKDLNISLAIVGPEESLALGMVNDLQKAGIPAYGPKKEAAQLEGSKAWAVNFMRRHGIPHPQSKVVGDFDAAIAFVNSGVAWLRDGIVVKASGLAAGKGVFVCATREEAVEALKSVMVKKTFGKAGEEVLIQQRLRGFEVSAMAIVAGLHYVMLPYSEDHKQVFDNDCGPNTGGMGVAAPHPLITPELAQKIESQIIIPTLQGLRKERIDFRGTLYPGIMIVGGEPYVLEYNVRFGDPETQAVLPLLNVNNEDGGIDFVAMLEAAVQGNLREASLRFNHRYPLHEGFSVAVTLASGGYPGKYENGKPIIGLKKLLTEEKVLVFHGATEVKDGKLVTNGGRVLYIAGSGSTIQQARETVYSVIGEKGIHFEGVHFRKDIGARKRT